MEKKKVDLMVVLRRKEMEMVVMLLVMEEMKFGRRWGSSTPATRWPEVVVAGWVLASLGGEEEEEKR